MNTLVKGFVEKIGTETVIGWACNQANPEVSVRVEARVNGQALATTLADVSRSDLKATGIGTGNHGFSLPASPELVQQLKRGTAQIWVSPRDHEAWQELPIIAGVGQDPSLANRVLRSLSGIRRRATLATGAPALSGAAPMPGAPSPQASGQPLSVETGFDDVDVDAHRQADSHTFKIDGKLFGAIDTPRAGSVDGWMLAARARTTPVLMVNGVPAHRNDWPLSRPDVIEHFGVQRRTGFHFEFNSCPGGHAELKAFDGHQLYDVTDLTLPSDGPPHVASVLQQLRQDAARPDAVAVTCWEGGHNPIGRAKVLYDILDGRRPVWLFCYLFDEFGGKLWAPLANSNLRIVTIPWTDRDRYHRMLAVNGIKFPTVWMCKPRFPTLLLSSVVAAPDARLVLDLDDNEEHFSRSPGSVGKPYGGETIGLVRNLVDSISARTAASRSLAEDFRTEIVRHARKPAVKSAKRGISDTERPLRIGFIGTARAHKRILDAAQAIRVANYIGDRALEFHVHGDIRPEEFRQQLEANSARTHGTVLAEDLQATLQTFDIVLTGYPTLSPADEPITRYQITSKIGDALANGIPALVPWSRSVADLEDTPGIFLFDSETFQEKLTQALHYSRRIKLPKDFALDGAYQGFEKAEAAAPRDAGSLRSIAPLPTFPPQAATDAKSILLIWKQQDGGMYGRRVDQIARAIKLERPEVTVRIVEFMNDSVKEDLEKRADSFLSDAAKILSLSAQKVSGTAVSRDGVIYNQMRVASDAAASEALQTFLLAHGHAPSNTLVVTFPAFALLTQLAPVLDPFPMIADIVDNQLSWGDNRAQPGIVGQYVWAMKNARHVVFNSQANMAYFRDAAFLNDIGTDRVSVVANWYTAPGGQDLHRTAPPQTVDGKVNIIYSGNLNDRIDWDLFTSVVRLSDKVRLHIVGDGSRVSDKIRALMDYPNTIYRGPLSEDQVSALLGQMHFAIMPHVKDEVSSFMNPLKVLMYSAHGLSSIATTVPGLNDIDGLTAFDDRDAFIDAVRQRVSMASDGTLPQTQPLPTLPEQARTYVDLVMNAI